MHGHDRQAITRELRVISSSRLVNPKPHMGLHVYFRACLVPRVCAATLPGSGRMDRWGTRNSQCLSKVKGRRIDTRCAGAEDGDWQKRWDEKKGRKASNGKSCRPVRFEVGSEQDTQSPGQCADETCLNQQNSEAPESFLASVARAAATLPHDLEPSGCQPARPEGATEGRYGCWLWTALPSPHYRVGAQGRGVPSVGAH